MLFPLRLIIASFILALGSFPLRAGCLTNISDCGFGRIDVPKPLDPSYQLKAGARLGEALRSGNKEKVSESLGDVLINTTGCFGCEPLAHKILPSLSKTQIDSIVGEGYIVYLSTGEPVLVTIDVVTTANELALSNDAPAPFVEPEQPVKIRSRRFSGMASCIIKHSNEQFAIFKGSPKLRAVDGQGPGSVTRGDTVVLSAKICSQYKQSGDIPLGRTTMVLKKISFTNEFPPLHTVFRGN